MGTLLLRTRPLLPLLAALTLTAAPGCGSNAAQSGTDGAGATSGAGGGTPLDPGTIVTILPSSTREAEAASLQARVSAMARLDSAGLLSRHQARFEAAPSYDLTQVAGLDRIQASHLALEDAELAALGTRGFVITDNRAFPSFAYGYSTIYLEDLPVYISADSLLDAVHRSYEDMLKTLEGEVLLPELGQLLRGMHDKLHGGLGARDATTVKDADLFLSVARSLLADSFVPPVSGADADHAKKLFELAQEASGVANVTLFGVAREHEDFSQFQPRGHYADSPGLSRYFKAMMWLGRVDLRLIETTPTGGQLFRRRQVDAMLLLADLVGTDLRPRFDRIDRTVAAFVGEPDYMTLPQVKELLAALGASSAADVAALPDQTVAQAIINGDFGAQRISSHIMISGPHEGTLPLSRSFAFLGQRYVLDSHVFSNVVYDRVNGDGPKRMMPNPLDAAFAALGNDQAATLLGDELTRYEASGYPGALAQVRLLADEHPPAFWSGSLYTQWLGALRELSPRTTSSAQAAAELFPVARTEAWGRRLLNTQLASWAQLRHDTILYAKQSYSGGASCDFPDGYVDPYPSFYAALTSFATRGQALISSLDLGGEHARTAARLVTYFQDLATVTGQLGAIAEHQRSGAELTPAMLAFINEAVVVQNVCGGGTLESGWYKRLFLDAYTALEADPTIADVHTQPTDEGGAMVGRVLHVGTGTPRLMVVVAEGCSGPRAYAGLASTYREKVTENFERLTDEKWASQGSAEPEPRWMADLVSGRAAPAISAE
ncbi:MAG: hypothetical protein K0R38_1736 [Polyangiaceae bacterium]|nr:hypothetical protein [Polyangiaceae bacterium]